MESLPAHGEGFDAVTLHFEASADGCGHRDFAVFADGDLWLDDVLGPVTAGGGDVAGR